MGQRLPVHPVTPQGRFLDRAAEVLNANGVVILPTDTCYALVGLPGSREAAQQMARIKEFDDEKKLFSLIVPGLSDVAKYARVSDSAYRVLRRYLPGPYTFVLPATRDAPRILGTKRKTVGLRVPGHPVPIGVAERVGGLIIATTLQFPGDDQPLLDPDDIETRCGKLVDLFLDNGFGGAAPTTVVDLTEDEPKVIRAGAGDTAPFD